MPTQFLGSPLLGSQRLTNTASDSPLRGAAKSQKLRVHAKSQKAVIHQLAIDHSHFLLKKTGEKFGMFHGVKDSMVQHRV